MSAPPEAANTTDPSRDGRRVAAVVGGVVLVLVVAVLVLVLGYTPPPAFTDAAAAPDASRTGEIALLVSERDTWCLSVVTPADGTSREVMCERGWIAADEVAWTDLGNIALLGYLEEPGVPVEREPVSGTTRSVRVVHPSSGAHLGDGTITNRPVPTWPLGTVLRDDGARIRLVQEGSGQASLVVVDADGSRYERLAVTGPLDYRFEGAAWSPDGEWILLLDNRQRLLVMSVDGDDDPVALTGLSRGQWLIAPPAWSQPGFDRALVIESSIHD